MILLPLLILLTTTTITTEAIFKCTVKHAIVPFSNTISTSLHIPDHAWSLKTTINLLLSPSSSSSSSSSSSNPLWTASSAQDLSNQAIQVSKPKSSIYALLLEYTGHNNVNIMKLYPACWVSPSDTIQLHLDNKGNVFSFDWIPETGTCSESDKIVTHLTTSVQVLAPVSIPRPMKSTAEKPSRLQNQSNKQVSDADKGTVDESDLDDVVSEKQSFLSKYWMYLLPIILLFMIGGSSEEPKRDGTSSNKAHQSSSHNSKPSSKGMAVK